MKIGVLGCNGKVGKQLVKTLYYSNPAYLGGCLENPNSNVIGEDIGTLINTEPLGVKITADPETVFKNSDVFIDFTYNSVAIEHVKLANKYKKPIVIGTTGFNDAQDNIIKQCAKDIPIVKSSNMSLGMNVLFKVVEDVAKILNKELYDVEIIEKHHKNKKDAPSGSALYLGNVIAKARKENLSNITHQPRKGLTHGREPHKIAFHAVRGGTLIGEHSVLFIGDGEVLEFTHSSCNRDIFVNGAIKAAKWIIGKPNGLYSFREIIEKIFSE